MSKVLVCYDIQKENRRAKVRKISKQKGQHHQLSVFLLEESPVKNLLQTLEVFVDKKVDRLLIAKLKGEVINLGKPYETFNWRF